MNKDDLSRLKTNLPQAPGILGKKEYFNSAVLVPLVMIDGDYNFLFQKRAAHIRQGGEICFPGGRYDPEKDFSCKETAIRETMEELGVERNIIKIEGGWIHWLLPWAQRWIHLSQRLLSNHWMN